MNESEGREAKGRSVEGGAQSDGGVLVLEYIVAGEKKTTVEITKTIVPSLIPVPNPHNTECE